MTAHASVHAATPQSRRPTTTASHAIVADRIFDGARMLDRHALVVDGDRIAAVAPADNVDGTDIAEFTGTLLPGIIDLHTHQLAGGVPGGVIVRHGVTTVRDVGGPRVPPGNNSPVLRMVRAGPILTAPSGYPIPVFGSADVAWEVADAAEARAAVTRLVADGVTVIKIAVEPGGSPGAPWTAHAPTAPPPWPVLPVDVVGAVVDEAHSHGVGVTCHLSGPDGARVALDAGVDEWAHVPCELLPDDLISRAADAGVHVISTLDTHARCPGAMDNATRLTAAGVRLLYGTDMAHPDVPWGVDAQELMLMLHAGHGALTAEDVLAAATARAGAHLGLDPLGQLVAGAPADVIGVRGDPRENLKSLEYPDLVIAAGTIVHVDRSGTFPGAPTAS
jgi:imidazolonepropionase-like amidohydrolase